MANFFMDDTIIQISKPLALLTRGHAKKIELTPTYLVFIHRPLISKSMTPESSTYSVLSCLKGSKRTLDFSSSTEIKAP